MPKSLTLTAWLAVSVTPPTVGKVPVVESVVELGPHLTESVTVVVVNLLSPVGYVP